MRHGRGGRDPRPGRAEREESKVRGGEWVRPGRPRRKAEVQLSLYGDGSRPQAVSGARRELLRPGLLI